MAGNVYGSVGLQGGDAAIDIARITTPRRERSITFASVASSRSCCRIAVFGELQKMQEIRPGAVRNQQSSVQVRAPAPKFPGELRPGEKRRAVCSCNEIATAASVTTMS